MKKTKPKIEPYIDYETANRIYWLRSFILDYDKTRARILADLNRVIATANQAIAHLNPTKEEQDKYRKWCGEIDPIEKLKHDFYEYGNYGLWDKLADPDFALRFRGLSSPPVSEKEIVNWFEEWEESQAKRKKEGGRGMKNQIGCRVSFPSSFFMELEDCWKYESGGCHRALTFQDFLNMLVGYGLESYKAKNLPRPEEAPVADEAPDPADAEAWEFPRSNRRPLLRGATRFQ